jgi:hypothetical protein
MKTKLIVLFLVLAFSTNAYQIRSPETELRSMINQPFIEGAKHHPRIDFKKIQKNNVSFTKVKVLGLLKSLNEEKNKLRKIKIPPYENVVEMTKPRHIRFYFERRMSKEKNQGAIPWFFVLVKIETMESNAPSGVVRQPMP